MSSRLTVMLVSLLLATPALIFWLWLMIQPTREAIQCPEKCRCEWDRYLVDCTKSSLNNIPSVLPTHVRELVLEGNRITSFQKDSFFSRGLIQLKRINADFCNITEIELGALNGLTVLTYLSLKNNTISEIIPGTFEKMNSLEILDLKYNIIQRLNSDTFYGLVNLKILSLKGNKLQYIHPDTFVGLPNIQF